jgi:FlaA1/EpsC-like NDP-sugar epimerase
MNILNLIGREKELFEKDININAKKLAFLVEESSFLVIGGAGSIGQAVTKEIFTRRPKTLHVVDLSENNLVELVRDIRSSHGYIDGDFRTFALDCGSLEFEVFFKNEGPYDYVLNLSALKHVRSEKDSYTLMRMIDVNILNTIKTINLAIDAKTKKYFCVSTDKAANPVNLMGASKRIMEMFLLEKSQSIDISTARFANVAFSEGSLLHGFNQRILKKQAIAAPNDIKRYFITPKEAGELCLISALLGENGDVFFPKFSKELNLITFSSIAEKYLQNIGYEPYECMNEEEARSKISELISQKKWPCLFLPSDTTGEKDFEEFFTENETINLERFQSLGIVKNSNYSENEKMKYFLKSIEELKRDKHWEKQQIVTLFKYMIPNFVHKETGKYLDGKM